MMKNFFTKDKIIISKQHFLTKFWIVILIALFCSILWGSAFPIIKIGYNILEVPQNDTFKQLLFAGIRFILSGLMVIIIGSIKEKKLIKPKMSSLKNITILSMFQTVLQYLFFYIGLAHTTGVKSSIIKGIGVFITVLIVCLIFKMENLTKNKIIGCIIGFIGVLIVNLSSAGIELSISIIGEGFILLSTIFSSLSSIYIKRFSKSEKAIVLCGYQFLLGGIILTAIGLFMGARLQKVSFLGLIIIVYLAFVSAVAYTLWSILLQHNNVSKIAVFGFMIPLFGVVLSALILDEYKSLNIFSVISLILVSVGIIIVNFEESCNKDQGKRL